MVSPFDRESSPSSRHLPLPHSHAYNSRPSGSSASYNRDYPQSHHHQASPAGPSHSSSSQYLPQRPPSAHNSQRPSSSSASLPNESPRTTNGNNDTSLRADDSETKPKVRASRACSSCNRQKLRCDGNHPCVRCVTLKIEEQCQYLPSLRGKTRKRKDKPKDGEGGAKKRRKSGSTSVEERTDRPGGPDQMYPHGMDSVLALWKRDAALNDLAPPISALWGSRDTTPPDHRSALRPPSPPGPQFGPASPTESEQRRLKNPAGKLTTLPLPGDAHNPLAVLAEASATAQSDQDVQAVHKASFMSLGKEADEAYYAPLERALQVEAPHIMTFIKVHEAEHLFEMYFKYLHPHLPFLDRRHSSPYAVARRNNFLFNAICVVSARAFNVNLWDRLKDFARFEMERFPREKNIDVVQGHLIYSTWNLFRPKYFEQDMSWLRVGVGVRAAIDINLHRVALVRQAREGLPTWLLRSLIRTWLLSYILDRTLSAQLGKPGTLNAENATRMYQKLILQGEERPTADDVWVSALAEWAQILVRAVDVFRSEAAEHSLDHSDLVSNQHSFPSLVRVFDKQFRQWREDSEARARIYATDERSVLFMLGNIRLYDYYARLVVHSFGLERAVESLPIDLPAAFAEYQTSATRLINGFEVDLEQPGLTRGCPDFVFTVLTYAAVSLLKCTEPRFNHLDPHRPSIFMQARKAADILARAAMSPDHLPASQSVFITRLIEVKSADARYRSNDVTIQPIDFEAFGHSLDQDTSKTLWPPMPSNPANGHGHGHGHGPGPPGELGHGFPTNREPNAPSRLPDGPSDLNSWASQNQGYPVPGAALGLGVGSFSQDQDMLFGQDAFWKSILDGARAPENATTST